MSVARGESKCGPPPSHVIKSRQAWSPTQPRGQRAPRALARQGGRARGRNSVTRPPRRGEGILDEAAKRRRPALPGLMSSRLCSGPRVAQGSACAPRSLVPLWRGRKSWVAWSLAPLRRALSTLDSLRAGRRGAARACGCLACMVARQLTPMGPRSAPLCRCFAELLLGRFAVSSLDSLSVQLSSPPGHEALALWRCRGLKRAPCLSTMCPGPAIHLPECNSGRPAHCPVVCRSR